MFSRVERKGDNIMYCEKCGARVPDDLEFCSSCGARLLFRLKPSTAQNQGYNQQQSQSTYQSNYQQEFASSDPADYKMKWFKLLIYFSLFASAIFNCFNAWRYLTGSVYESLGDIYELYGSNAGAAVYYVYPGLKAADVVYGIAVIAIAVFSVYTRFQLSGYKKNGPMCLLVLYAFNAIVAVVYVLAGSAIIGQNCMDASTIATVASSVVMILANRTYFNKRKSLFVN